MGNVLVKVDDELIAVKQLPIIEDRLDELHESVQARLSSMFDLVVTEENYKEIKKTRAELNKELGSLETLKKKVKSAIEAPYNRFENGAYKRIKDEYNAAISDLDSKIKSVEFELITQREQEVQKYFNDYRTSLGLDFDIADFQRSGIKVGLSESMKSMKQRAKDFLDKIDGDLKLIDTLEDKDEVLVEYRVLMNVSEAVLVVKKHHIRIEEEKKRREALEEARAAKEATEAAVNAAIAQETREQSESSLKSEGDNVSAPTVQVAVEEQETQEAVLHTSYLKYDIYGTITQLKGLKEAMVNCLIDYCEREGMKYGKSEQ